jgi:hypothetical protein
VRRFVNGFRILDQRFMTAQLIKYNGRSQRAPEYRVLPYKEVPRTHKLKDGVFLHYGASSHKWKYVEWLHERADELGYRRLT